MALLFAIENRYGCQVASKKGLDVEVSVGGKEEEKKIFDLIAKQPLL